MFTVLLVQIGLIKHISFIPDGIRSNDSLFPVHPVYLGSWGWVGLQSHRSDCKIGTTSHKFSKDRGCYMFILHVNLYHRQIYKSARTWHVYTAAALCWRPRGGSLSLSSSENLHHIFLPSRGSFQGPQGQRIFSFSG